MGIVEKDRELIPADTITVPMFPERVHEGFIYGDDSLIPRNMPMGIIDELQVVQVKERKPETRGFLILHMQVEVPVEGGTVVSSREAVPVGQPLVEEGLVLLLDQVVDIGDGISARSR